MKQTSQFPRWIRTLGMLGCVLLNACGRLPTMPPPATKGTNTLRLMLCDRNQITQVQIDADGSSQSKNILALSKNWSCPKWSPAVTGAILEQTDEVAHATEVGRYSFRTRLHWYDPAQSTLVPMRTQLDLDGDYTAVWQGQMVPRLAQISTRNDPSSCAEFVYSRNEKSLCRSEHGALYLVETDAERNAALLVDPIRKRSFCRVVPSPDGFWLAVVQGTCAGAGYDSELRVIRLDSGEVQTVPISSALHSVLSVTWHPTQTRLLISARYLPARGAPADLLVYSLDSQRLVTWAHHLRDLQFVAWRGDDVVFVDGAVLALAREHVLNAQPLSDMPMAIARCIVLYQLARNEQILVRRDRCDRTRSVVQWLDFETSTLQTAQLDYSATGNLAVSPDGQWIALTAWMRGLPGPSISVGKLVLINTRTRMISEVGDVSLNAQFVWVE